MVLRFRVLICERVLPRAVVELLALVVYNWKLVEVNVESKYKYLTEGVELGVLSMSHHETTFP